MTDVVDIARKLSLVTDTWSPKVVARLNDYEIKVVKLHGEFVWHSHDDTDELFLVVNGHLQIQLCDGAVELGPRTVVRSPQGRRALPHRRRGGSRRLDRAGGGAEHR